MKHLAMTSLVELIEQTIPELSFTAHYEAESPVLKASMRLYKKRAFVYVLAVDHNGQERYLYVGKSEFQYSRMLQHIPAFAFDRVYLFECQPEVLLQCEKAVIRLLMPLFNRQHNPNAAQYRRVLRIEYDVPQDSIAIARYLEAWDRYMSMGVFGFALPPVLYRILRQESIQHSTTVSQELVAILEALFEEEICTSLHQNPPVEEVQTNLITTSAYGAIHGKSQEQIKQYLHQGDRLIGQKVGRDWVVLNDEKYPNDRREKLTLW